MPASQVPPVRTATPVSQSDPNPPPVPPLGIAIWSLNACTLKSDDVIPLANSFSDSVRWDVLCIQEGVRHRTGGVETDSGVTIISGPGSAVGAPQLLLNRRLGSRLRQWTTHPNYVIASVGTTPPLLLFSLYLPAQNSQGIAPFEHTLQTFQEDLQRMQSNSPGSFVLGAADCNTQLRPMPGHVGPWTGASERLADQERTDLLHCALATLGLIAPSSYVDLGPTRTPWPGQAPSQQPSVIDYLFASPKIKCNVQSDNLPTPDTSTDHNPIGMVAYAPYASRRDRRKQFEAQQANNSYWKDRLPAQWTPSSQLAFRNRIKHTRLTSLTQIPTLLHDAAKDTPSAELTRHLTKKKLLDKIRSAKDPVIRKAYQIQLRSHRKTQRLHREFNKIIAGAKGDNWDFSRQAKIPTKLRYPESLEGDDDRGNWGNLVGEYLTNLYEASPQEVEEVNEGLVRILRTALTHQSDMLTCCPNELRDLIRDLPHNKAAGPDGIPSQLLKYLTIQQVVDLARLFTQLANDLDYRPASRPEIWNQTLAMMLPKDAGATTLDRHRAIALMCQLQKLYAKWLLVQMTPVLDPLIDENQSGFRRQRQASEVLHVISKLIEMAIEWKQPLTIVRLDLRKAFDRLKQSAILSTLEVSPLHPKLIFNAARELVGTVMRPTLYGCTPEAPVPLAQGTKQGAPESGLYFVATLNYLLQPAIAKWTDRQEGCHLGSNLIHHLIFADDLLLLSPTPPRAHKMLQEIQPTLASGGLEINESKTAYLTTHPQMALSLPGTNANEQGMKILGRTFTLADNTQQDMDLKIATAWGRFNRIRHILRAYTPLPHRLRIFKSCVGQALLWASETWHLTRKRLQRIRGVELAMMRTLIPCPKLPEDTPLNERFATHKKHIRDTLKAHKYEGLDRLWARKYHSWAGHLARLPPTRIAHQALHTKNLAWWRKQQAHPEGHRHEKRRGNLSRWENPLGRHHPNHENWHIFAQNRERWKATYPIFEQRLFGRNSPHDFECPPRDSVNSNNSPDPHSQPPGKNGQTRASPHTPGKTPRENLREEQERQAPAKRRRKSGQFPKSLLTPNPPAKLTQAQIAAKWEEDLNKPLISLASCQDVRPGNEQRSIPGVSRKPSHFQAHDLCNSRILEEGTSSTPAGLGDGDRHSAVARPAAKQGTHTRRTTSISPSAGSSTSTSSSSSSTSSSSSSSRAVQTKGKGKGKGKERRRQKGRRQQGSRQEGRRQERQDAGGKGKDKRQRQGQGASEDREASTTPHAHGKPAAMASAAAAEATATAATPVQTPSSAASHWTSSVAAATAAAAVPDTPLADERKGQHAARKRQRPGWDAGLHAAATAATAAASAVVPAAALHPDTAPSRSNTTGASSSNGDVHEGNRRSLLRRDHLATRALARHSALG